MKKNRPAGIELLGYFYILTAISLAVSFILGQNLTDAICLGQKLSKGWAIIVMTVLMIMPLAIYLGFSHPNRIVWRIAMGYHLFFTLNSLLGLIFILNPKLPIKPIIRITGKDYFLYASDILTMKEAFSLFLIFNLNLLLGVAILLYLWQRRDYFLKIK